MSQIIIIVILHFFVFLQFSHCGQESIFDYEYRKDAEESQAERAALTPSGLKAQNINDSAVQIEWKLPSVNIHHSIEEYIIYIFNKNDRQRDVIYITENPGRTSNYTINNLKPYTRYRVWISVSSMSSSQYYYSQAIDFITDVTGPSAPIILNVSCQSNNAIYIQWQTPKVFNHTVDIYYVYYRSENEEFKEVVVIAKPMIDNNLLHEDLIIRCLVKGKEYEVKVQGATRSVKKSGLIFRGEFSESKKIKLQHNSTILEPNNKTNKNSIDSYLPRFVSKGEIKEVREGENIDLQCQVENLGDYLIIWNYYHNKKTEILFVGTMRLTTNQRFSLINDSVLTINGIQTNLIGNYRCVITTYPPQEIVFTIKLLDNSDEKIPLPSNKIEDTVVLKVETNLETKINNIDAIIHEKLDELLKLSDTINRRIKQIGLRTIGTVEVFNDFNNSSLWHD